MDTKRLISDLMCEKALIDQAITFLKSLERSNATGPGAAPKRRGRKFMDAAERERVSARMRTYWAERRAKGSSRAAA